MAADRDYEMTTTDSGVPVRLLPTERQPKEDCLTLTPHELAWLNEFRKRLLDQFPTSVRDIIVHGYRVRGLADEDLWMEVFVLTNEEHPRNCDQIDEIAYDVSLIDHHHPRVRTLPQSTWSEITEKRSRFWSSYREVLEEGISVL